MIPEMISSPTSQRRGELTEFIDENGQVDFEGFIKKYPNDDDIPEDVFRMHYAAMKQNQRSHYLELRDKHRADKIRADITKRYNLENNAADSTILAVNKFEIEHESCKNCKGDTCQRNFNEPILIWNDGKATLEHRYCTVRHKYFKQLQLEKRVTSSEIPQRYHGKTFEDYIETDSNKDALDCAKWILDNNEFGLLITGGCGCGKTMLSAIIANESIKRGRTVLFATVPDLLNNIKRKFNSESGTEDIVKSIKNVDVLVLDDFGVEKMTDWVAETLFTIINERYNNQRQTIITSNLTVQAMESNLNGEYSETGTRIISRIRSMCKRVEIKGKDWRVN